MMTFYINGHSLITILSIVGAPIAYFLNQNSKEKERKTENEKERNRPSKNLFTELNDTLEALNGSEYLTKIKINDNEFYFVRNTLNHDFYDSLINSGKINFLKSELQQPIQDIFQRIKDHNSHMMKIRSIEDNANQNENIDLKTARYYKILEKTESRLLVEIPKMKSKLKNEFKI